MNLERVTCGSCGASLDVPERADYVNCQHCGSSLHVQRTDSVVFTEVVNTLNQHLDRIADNTEVLRLQKELELLDQEWRHESAGLMLRDNHGREGIPTKQSSAMLAVVFMVFSVIWMTLSWPVFPPLALLGIVSMFFGLFISSRTYSMADRFETLQRLYDKKREKIQSRLRTLRLREDSETSSFES